MVRDTQPISTSDDEICSETSRLNSQQVNHDGKQRKCSGSNTFSNGERLLTIPVKAEALLLDAEGYFLYSACNSTTEPTFGTCRMR